MIRMLAFGMPAEFTRDQIAAIAALAHLELDASEIDLFAKQLGDILAYAEVGQQIDTTGVPPTASVVAQHAADPAYERRPLLDLETALPAAPDAALYPRVFGVPRVIG